MKRKLQPAALAALAMVATPTAAQNNPAPPPASYGPAIGLEAAQTIVERAVAESRKGGFHMAIAVVDTSGELVAFARMDDTQFGSIGIAHAKARTAARMRSSTADIEKRVLAGRTVTLAVDDIMPIAGGVPIVVDGKVVGGLGVSGAAASDDDVVARAALAPAG